MSTPVRKSTTFISQTLDPSWCTYTVGKERFGNTRDPGKSVAWRNNTQEMTHSTRWNQSAETGVGVRRPTESRTSHQQSVRQAKRLVHRNRVVFRPQQVMKPRRRIGYPLLVKSELCWIRSIPIDLFGIEDFFRFGESKRITALSHVTYRHTSVKAGSITYMAARPSFDVDAQPNTILIIVNPHRTHCLN